jgi:hypothetical protein
VTAVALVVAGVFGAVYVAAIVMAFRWGPGGRRFDPGPGVAALDGQAARPALRSRRVIDVQVDA